MHRRLPAIALSVLALAASPRAQAPGVAELVDRFSTLDVDGDGGLEIEALHLLGSAGEAGKPAVAVLVEAGLLERAGAGALDAALVRFAEDLAADGFTAHRIAVDVRADREHHDGRRLLALRRFLAAWHAECAPLAGAVLVGRFPDAFLVRTCNWRKRGTLTAGGRKFDEPVRYLRRVPEIVAPRCDLVLADLDGDWEGRLVDAETELDTLYAVFPGGVPAGGGPAEATRLGTFRCRDFFLVEDGRATVDGDTIAIDDDTRDLECTSADRGRGNAMALPEIAVSRIDARGVAWSPRTELDGRPLVDADGAPLAVELRDGESAPHWRNDLWVPDPALELRLLVEYFDRNHRYRTAGAGDAFRPASIAHGLPSGFRVVKRAAAEWSAFGEPGYDVAKGASLVDLVQWLRRPAVLRTLRAHSDPRSAVFAATEEAALAAELGGPPLCWRARGRALVPSLAAATGGRRAGFFLYRTLWENGALPDHPYLMIHTGCEALAPPDATKRSYDDPRYGAFPNAESLLFLTPCVALVGRAKVFYDEPRGFCETLRDGGTFGDAWRRYFDVESSAASWREVGGDIGRKRAYFWSVVGDWTLRLGR